MGTFAMIKDSEGSDSEDRGSVTDMPCSTTGFLKLYAGNRGIRIWWDFCRRNNYFSTWRCPEASTAQMLLQHCCWCWNMCHLSLTSLTSTWGTLESKVVGDTCSDSVRTPLLSPMQTGLKTEKRCSLCQHPARIRTSFHWNQDQIRVLYRGTVY